MKIKKRSRHLDVPAESNRDKHVNFEALESGETDPGADTYGQLYNATNPGRENDDDDEDEKEDTY